MVNILLRIKECMISISSFHLWPFLPAFPFEIERKSSCFFVNKDIQHILMTRKREFLFVNSHSCCHEKLNFLGLPEFRSFFLLCLAGPAPSHVLHHTCPKDF